jgi:hypothetical protein
MTLPPWTARWCRDHLGASPAKILLRERHMSEVFGLRLTDGREVAWAASLWLAVHNARAELLSGSPLVAFRAVQQQGSERLRRAGA